MNSRMCNLLYILIVIVGSYILINAFNENMDFIKNAVSENGAKIDKISEQINNKVQETEN